jgi:hypothetical protein
MHHVDAGLATIAVTEPSSIGRPAGNSPPLGARLQPWLNSWSGMAPVADDTRWQ